MESQKVHGNDDPKYDNENFSGRGLINDKSFSEFVNLPLYLATPSGKLRCYLPEEQKDIRIFPPMK